MQEFERGLDELDQRRAEALPDLEVLLSAEVHQEVLDTYRRVEGQALASALSELHLSKEKLAQSPRLQLSDDLRVLSHVGSLAGFPQALPQYGEEPVFDQVIRSAGHFF